MNKKILILFGLISLILVIIGMVYIFDEKKIAKWRLFIKYVRQHVIPTSTIKFYPGMFQNKEFRYRLGDMVRGKKHRIDEKHGKKYHCKNFPNSIACQYMEQTNKNNDFPVLLKILAKNKIKAPQDVIVIHLRIGDVIDDCEKCTVNDFLLGKKCVIFSEGKSYVKPLSFYQENMIHCKNTRLKKITIMIGAHQSNKKNSYKSYEYVMVIKSLFEQEGFKVDLRYQNSPDDDFAYATSAKYFFPGGGGYSQLIKNVNYRLGGIILPFKCSVFIMNYNRPHNIIIQLQSLINNPYIDEIIISNGHPDFVITTKEIQGDISKLKIQNDFKLNDEIGAAKRCKLAQNVHNDYVLMLDDDIIPSDTLIRNLLYNVSKNPMNIYGPITRLCNKDGYHFNPGKKKYNIILPGLSMTSKQLLKDFMKNGFNKDLAWFKKYKGNCEDLSLNVFLHSKNIKPTEIKGDYKWLDISDGYSSNKNHKIIRDDFCKTRT